MNVPRFSATSAFSPVGLTVINKPYNQQIERISTTLKPLIFNMLLERENGKIHREEFIAKLGRRQYVEY